MLQLCMHARMCCRRKQHMKEKIRTVHWTLSTILRRAAMLTARSSAIISRKCTSTSHSASEKARWLRMCMHACKRTDAWTHERMGRTYAYMRVCTSICTGAIQGDPMRGRHKTIGSTTVPKLPKQTDSSVSAWWLATMACLSCDGSVFSFVFKGTSC